MSNLLDSHMQLQDAVGAPRWRMDPQTAWTDASLEIEGRLDEQTASGLRRLGHQVRVIRDWEAGGAAQLISIDDHGFVGAGDPRLGTGPVLGF